MRIFFRDSDCANKKEQAKQAIQAVLKTGNKLLAQGSIPDAAQHFAFAGDFRTLTEIVGRLKASKETYLGSRAQNLGLVNCAIARGILVNPYLAPEKKAGIARKMLDTAFHNATQLMFMSAELEAGKEIQARRMQGAGLVYVQIFETSKTAMDVFERLKSTPNYSGIQERHVESYRNANTAINELKNWKEPEMAEKVRMQFKD